MISVNTEKTYIYKGREVLPFHGRREALAFASEHGIAPQTDFARETMAYSVLSSHNSSKDEGKLCIKFDALASHDITYVGIIQTARASGLTEFPVPYALTNCHNSLCAVGGTLNEDDHVFGLSAAKKYGGIFVPPHIAVIHSYAREMLAGCGKKQETDGTTDTKTAGTETQSDATALSAKYVYQAEYLELPVKTNYIDKSVVSGAEIDCAARLNAASSSRSSCGGRNSSSASSSGCVFALTQTPSATSGSTAGRAYSVSGSAASCVRYA